MFVSLVKMKVCTILSKFNDSTANTNYLAYILKMQEANLKVKLMYSLFSFN